MAPQHGVIFFFSISFAGKAWTASRAWTHGDNERNIIFSSPCILTTITRFSQKISHTLVVPLSFCACFSRRRHFQSVWLQSLDRINHFKDHNVSIIYWLFKPSKQRLIRIQRFQKWHHKCTHLFLLFYRHPGLYMYQSSLLSSF